MRDNWKALAGAHKDPWAWDRSHCIGRPQAGDSLYPGILRELEKKLRAKSKIDFENHHQGFASYVDAWFYGDNDDFRDRLLGDKNSFAGLTVTLWRFGPYYILGEYPKSLGARARSSGLPSFEGIDHFPTPAVRKLSTAAENCLAEDDPVRLHKSQLAMPLPRILSRHSLGSRPREAQAFRCDLLLARLSP